LIEPFFT